jgi:hypothetical protein
LTRRGAAAHAGDGGDPAREQAGLVLARLAMGRDVISNFLQAALSQ